MFSEKNRLEQLVGGKTMIQIVKVKDYATLSKKAAMFIAAEIVQRKSPVLGLATGSTPVGTYRE